MFELYQDVLIKSKNIVGQIVDMFEVDGKTLFTVESNTKGTIDDKDAYGGIWPLFDCSENEIEKI